MLKKILIFTALAGLVVGTHVNAETILRLPPIDEAPIIDGKIDKAEWKNASTQFGAVSLNTKLLSIRQVTFFFTYDNENIYFAQRSEIPPAPMKLTDDDTAGILLLPPGAKGPYSFQFNSSNKGNLPDGSKIAGRINEGFWETEVSVPLASVGITKIEDGKEWGLQMMRNWQNTKETACWHLPDEKNKYGKFIPEHDIPTVSFEGLGPRYKGTGYNIVWTAVNTSKAKQKVMCDSDIMSVEVPRHQNRTYILESAKSASYEIREILLPGVTRTVNATASNPDSGKIYYQRSFSWDVTNGLDWLDPDPPVILDIGVYPTYKKAKARLWCANTAKITNASDVIFRIRNEQGKVFCETKAEKRSNNDYYKMWDLPELPLGEYFVSAEMIGKHGKKSVIERDFAIRSFLWQNNDIGKDRIIIPPFTPLKVDKNKNEVHALQTGYRINGAAWDAVYAQGENILAAPIDFIINGEKFKTLGTKLISAETDKVVYESDLEYKALKLKAIHEYDFDGMCKMTLKFNPGLGIDIKELYLDVPLKKEYAKLYHCVGSGVRTNTSDFLKEGSGVVWDSKNKAEIHRKNLGSFRPYFWFGEIYKGITWFCETPRYWSQDPSRAAMEVIRSDKAATLRINIVNRQAAWKEPFEIVMGFQPTPVKPRPEEYRCYTGVMYRWYPDNAKTVRIGSGYGKGACSRFEDGLSNPPDGDYSYLEFMQAAKWKDRKEVETFAQNFLDKHNITDENYSKLKTDPEKILVRMWQECNFTKQAAHRFPYFNARSLCSVWPESKMYNDEWYLGGYRREFYDEYSEDPTPTYQDFSLYHYRAKVRENNGWYAGIYLDNIYDVTCSDTVTGPAVELGPEDYMPYYSIFNMRELLKRTAVMLTQEKKFFGGYPALYLHMTNCNITPFLSMAAVGLDWEMNFGDRDYPVRFPEGRVLAVTLGTQTGVMPATIVQASGNDVELRVRSLVAVMFYFNLMWQWDAGLPHPDFYKNLINKIRDFGYGDIKNVQVFPGWASDNPVKSNQEKVRCTVLKKNNGQTMLMVGNIGDTCKAELDISALKYPSCRISNAETGKEISTGQKVSLELPKYDYALLLVEAKK